MLDTVLNSDLPAYVDKNLRKRKNNQDRNRQGSARSHLRTVQSMKQISVGKDGSKKDLNTKVHSQYGDRPITNQLKEENKQFKQFATAGSNAESVLIKPIDVNTKVS